MTTWRKVRLGDVCELNPRRPPMARPDDQPTSFLPMAAIAEAGKGIQGMIERPFAEVRRGYTFVAEGDVLFAKITPCMQNGKHAIARDLLGGIAFASTEFHVLRPRSEAVIAEWVHSFLLAPDVRGAAESVLTGAVGQQRVPEAFVADLVLPVPPLAEQRRIVARLTGQLAVVQQARMAEEVLAAAVLGLVAAAREAVLRDEAGLRWPRVPLGALVVQPLRTGLSRQGSVESTERVLTLSAVRHGRLDLSATRPMDASEGERVRNEVRAGAFYVVRGNGRLGLVGRGGLAPADVPDRVLFPDLLIEVVVDPGRVAPQFFSLVWDSREVRAEIECRCRTSAGIHKINLQNLAKVAVPLPPMEVQLRIATSLAARLGSTSMAASAAEAELAAIEALPAALLREAFDQAT